MRNKKESKPYTPGPRLVMEIGCYRYEVRVSTCLSAYGAASKLTSTFSLPEGETFDVLPSYSDGALLLGIQRSLFQAHLRFERKGLEARDELDCLHLGTQAQRAKEKAS